MITYDNRWIRILIILMLKILYSAFEYIHLFVRVFDKYYHTLLVMFYTCSTLHRERIDG